MSTSSVALPAILDGQRLVESFGLVGLLLVVFAETGLLLGFFLPGDSLLFAAGYAATGHLSRSLHPDIVLVCVLASLVAVAGAQTGFAIGRGAGPALFDRPDSRLFKRAYVDKAEAVVERYGVGRAIVLARFVPIVRTFLNPLMGRHAVGHRAVPAGLLPGQRLLHRQEPRGRGAGDRRDLGAADRTGARAQPARDPLSRGGHR
jgi:membrane protein YqaA with SNARE-associated domain